MYGKVIRFMRLSKRLKQIEVAYMIGCSNCTLAHYESDCRALTFENLMRIADACNYEVLFRDKDKNKIYKFYDISVDYDIKITNRK